MASGTLDLPVSENTGAAIPHRQVKSWLRVATGLPLPLILAVQAFLSVRLIWQNTAFQDEALYLWAGHLEIAHWLHGSSLPAFPTFFSGAPVIYPPLGALANALGGLAAARLLSTAFMLGATIMLWHTARLLCGRRAAFFSAALWGLLGATVQLGAFATFDPMSQFLMALAAYCAVRAAAHGDRATGWTLGAAACLLLAGVTTYSALIFAPVVIALAMLSGRPEFSWPAARYRLTSLLAYSATALAILVKTGGPWYIQGVVHTVLDRASSDSPMGAVARQAWNLTGLVIVLAAAGAIIALFAERRAARRLLLVLLLLAGVLVPAEQARIHTLTSLNKHADLGAWFAAIAAGYALDRLVTLARPRAWRAVAGGVLAAALAVPVIAGAAQARTLNTWPNAAAFVRWLQPVTARVKGPLLVETPTVAEYYLPAGQQWKRWSSTFNITLPSGRVVEHSGRIGYPGDPLAYRKYIASGYFSLIALAHGSGSILDRALEVYIARNHEYVPAATIPYGTSNYTVWIRKAAQ